MGKCRFPVTVRDAQRLAPRYFRMCSDEENRIFVSIAHILGVKLNQAELMRALARYAAQHGSQSVLLASPEAASPESSDTSDRIHKIGTDEVAKQSANPSEDSQTHGGDSASGEVESGISEGGDKQQGNTGNVAGNSQGLGLISGEGGDESRHDISITGSGGVLPPQMSPDEAGAEPEESAAETGNTSAGTLTSRDDNGTKDSRQRVRAQSEQQQSEGESAPPDSCDSQTHNGTTNLDASDAGTRALTGGANAKADESLNGKDAGDPDETGSENYHYHGIHHGGGEVSTRANVQFGGITATLKRAGIEPRIVSQARAALSRLLEGGESEFGPRWDWVEFCKRLKTGRSVYLAHKEEEGRPAIMVLADVSGSCSGFSDESVIVAKSVATLGISGADIIVVAHSNGYPGEYQVNSDIPFWPGRDTVIAWYMDILKHYDVQVVVALGDWDAEWLYCQLAESSQVKKFIWLDNWSSTVLAQPVLRRDLFERGASNDTVAYESPWYFSTEWSRDAQRKTRYVVGCSDAADFVVGLGIALR